MTDLLYRSIPDMFLKRVAETPDKNAFAHPAPGDAGPPVWLTWREVAARAKAIAAGLYDLGVRTEDRVAILAGTRLEWVLADLGVMCAGAATTTVYPTTEPEDAEYIVREGNAGAKAGNINNALSVTSGEFFVILDADFVPAPDFLYQTVPFFAESNVAFVQTPQAYGNLNNLISRGAGYMQSVFYRFIQPGKNRFNAAFSVGTNVIYRRTAIESIGGMWTQSKSEDVWTSLKLHENGWKSTYISTVLAIGDTPTTIEAYTKQQLRWATGGFEILFKSNPFSRKLKLSLDQRLQYFGTATFYLMGVAPGLLLLVPPLQIYFGLAPINSSVSFGTWLLYYLGFYGMQVIVALYTIGSFRWETLMLATASFPIYGRALVNAIFNKDQKWHVTGSMKKKASPFTSYQ